MTGPDTAAKMAARLDRAQKQMREISENPEIARGAVGMVVLDMIRAGEEVSSASIIATLEALASGAVSRSGLNDVLARGALKVIADLRT